MFNQETYLERRNQLKKLVGNGVILLFGNNDSPCNFSANSYYPFRKDSSFLYYFGQSRDGLVGILDVNIDIEDIVWYGSVNSVHDMAAEVGVGNSAPMKTLKAICNDAMAHQRKIHYLPPY